MTNKKTAEQTPKLRKGERTARTILESAAICVATLGIEKSSITAIANEAGVSRALVAHYFPKKAKIFGQVIQYIAEQAYASVEAPHEGLSPEDEILHTFRTNMDFFLEHPHYYKCLILFYYFAGIDDEDRATNTRLVERATKRLDKAAKAMNIEVSGIGATLHSQLVAGVMKFFITDHKLSAKSYRDRLLSQVREELRALSG